MKDIREGDQMRETKNNGNVGGGGEKQKDECDPSNTNQAMQKNILCPSVCEYNESFDD